MAHLVGSEWVDRCEQAYRSITKPSTLELPTQLLMDIRSVFQETRDSRIASMDLVEKLCHNASGIWLECFNGKKLTQSKMANLLKPYGIIPHTYRFGDSTKRGYELTQFKDAFDRYLPN